ncbi:MAG: hypothetical protein ABH824_06055 [Nanoarchaeota archaeon]|nr:hypothetical protein [Nanoarchaeota archaeon]
MRIFIRGIKAWMIALVIFLAIIIFLIIIFQIFIILLPIIIILIILSYFFKMLNKIKKEKHKDFIDVKFKIKK